MTDYVTMQTRIADELIDSGALSTAQIKAAIQSAIKFYERKPFYFNQKKEGTFSTVASQEYYGSAANSDIPYIIQFFGFTIGTSKNPVTKVDFSAIDAVQTGSITGEPSSYAYWEQKIRLYPIPSAVYTATMAYIYRLTTLSADGDTNAWMTDAEELIRQSAKRILALDILHADDIAMRCYNREAEVFDELKAETARRMEAKLRVDWPFNGHCVEDWRQ